MKSVPTVVNAPEGVLRQTVDEPPPGFMEGLRLACTTLRGARSKWFLVYLGVLSVLFLPGLVGLAQLAARTELYSHLFLIPLISIYLAALKARQIPSRLGTDWGPALLCAVCGALVLGAYAWLTRTGWHPERVDKLAKSMAAYLAFASAGGFLFWGRGVMRAVAFPWLFLGLLIPFPKVVEDGLEMFFQYSSAEAANALFAVTNLPVLRDGLVFQIPGITIRVAQECSGIRSSLVLFITSLVAGQMFLSSGGARWFLAAFVIPLAIVRNAVRILVIAWLCVEVGQEMIRSWVHRQGGPLFFVLSLVPFFWCLAWLRRRGFGREKGGGLHENLKAR